MKNVTNCKIYTQRRGALKELAWWFMSVKKRKKEVEHNFLENEIQVVEGHVSAV